MHCAHFYLLHMCDSLLSFTNFCCILMFIDNMGYSIHDPLMKYCYIFGEISCYLKPFNSTQLNWTKQASKPSKLKH